MQFVLERWNLFIWSTMPIYAFEYVKKYKTILISVEGVY